MSRKPTYKELTNKLADAEKLIASLRDGEVEDIISERDAALLGVRELEEAYIESEQNFRNAMDICPLGVRIITEDGELLYANQAMLDICGLGSVEELKAIPRQGLYTPESYAEHQERKERRKQGESLPGVSEISIRRPDSGTRYLEVFRKGIIWGGENQYMSMYQDITERKKAEEELRKSEARFRGFFEKETNYCYMISPAGFILDLNSAALMAIGYTRDEIIGKPLLTTVYAPESRDHARKLFSEWKEKGKIENEELKIITKNGEERTVILNVSVVIDKAGEILHSVSIQTDITERKRAEEALKESEERFRTASQIASDVVYERDLQTGIATFYSDIDSHLGYEPGGYPRTMEGWRGHVHPEDLARIDNQGMDQIKPGVPYSIEYRVSKKDGTYMTWLDRIILIRDEETGKPSKFIGAATDITERKQAEEKHRTILKTALDGFWTVDMEGKFLEVNDSYCNMLGYTREELLKMSIKDVEFIEKPEEILGRIKKIAEQGSDRFETRHKRKDGQIIDVEVSTNYLDLGGGQVSVFVRDITRRKQAQERISNLNLTLHSIRNINQLITREKDRNRLIKGVCKCLVEINNCQNASVVLLDESLRFTTYAEAGLGRDFLPGLKFLKKGNLFPCVREALRKGDIAIVKDHLTMCAGCPLLTKHSDSWGVTLHLYYDGKTYGFLRVSLPRSMADDEDIVDLLKEVATDITFALHDIELEEEHKLLEEERLRGAKLESISTLAGGIAHDFNNLLTGIMGNIGLAKTYTAPSDKAFKTLDEAEKAAIRAKNLTQQLLTFARGGKPVKKVANITELVNESATFALRGSAAKLELSLPDKPWPVEVDEGQINQVIQNIVINADEAMPGGGILKIGAANVSLKKAGALPLPKGKYVRIEIQDTGIGISKAHLQRLFEPYFTTKKKGSGLGLSTAYSIIKNHGGYITAESTLNKGATFYIYLPVSKKQAKVKKELTPEKPARAGGKVLVMDDEEIIRTMLNNMLYLAGYQVELTSDGAEALEKYTGAMKAGEPFDAVIMDLTIPGGMGGKETIKKLKDIDPSAKAIVSSGYATDPIMSEYKKYGFSAVIAKPYSVKQVKETLQSLIKRKRLR